MKKTKVSKRILSVLLAALMVITSIPLIAFNVSAYTVLDKLTDAMNGYTSAMQTIASTTDKVYTKLKPAYDAYVAAQRQYDSLKYGGVDNGANNAAQTLNDAVTAMNNSAVSFDVYKGTAVPTFSDGTVRNVASYYYSNLLSSPTGTEQNRPMNDNELQKIKISLYYAPTVMLYDGVNETSLPAVLNYQYTAAVWSGTPSIYACYPSATTLDAGKWENEIAQTHEAMQPSTIWVMGGAQNTGKAHGNWKAWHPDKDVGVLFPDCVNATTDLHYPMGTNAGFVFTNEEKLTLRTRWNGAGKWGMAINKMVFKGDPDMTTTSKDYQPSWSTCRAWNNDLHLQVHHGTANNCKLTVVDFSQIRETLGNFGNTIKSYDVSQYKEGGLADLFAAMDTISAVRPMDYFTGKTDTAGLVAKIDDLKTNQIPKLTAAYTTDSADYKALRDTFDDSNNGIKSTYEAGNASNTYTAESWAVFDEKYKQAQKVMSDVFANGYTGAPVNPVTAKDELVAAKAGLQTVVLKVDTASLEALMDELLGIADYTTFTTATVNNATNVVNNAKTAIWGAVANYKNDAEKLDDSADAQAKVAEQMTLVEQAMKDLRFSPENEVSTDIGSASLQELLDEYPSLKANETDYSGFGDYEAAYNECKTYAETLPTTEMLDYYGQLDQYVAMVTTFLEARLKLKITFLKAPDGTIIKQPTLSPLTKNTMECINYSNIFYAGSIRYPQETVMLKTTHDAKDLKYGETVMTWEARQDSEYQVLDSITFHDSVVIPEGHDKNSFLNEFHSRTWFGAAMGGQSPIPDDKKDRYSVGDLTGEGAEMTNVKVISRLQVPLGTPYAQLGDGGKNYVNAPDDPRITGLIAHTDANVEDEHNGGLITKSTGEQEQGVVTFTGDMIAHTPATPKYTSFDQMPVPSEDMASRRADSYGIYGNTAFLYKWHIHGNANMGQILGYSYLQLADISSACYVVDISYLVDLINMVKDTPSAPYTEESYTAFINAFNNAKNEYPFEDVINGAATVQNGANNVAVAMMNKYDDLYNAYAGLEYKQFDVTFNYKDANGLDKSSVVKVTYNELLSKYQQQIANISTPAYEQGGYKYTFAGWSPEVDLNAPVTGNLTYTAQYTSQVLPADWSGYDFIKENIIALLDQNQRTYSAADLEKVQSLIESAKYWDEADREGVTAVSQDDIIAEAQMLYANLPTAVNIDVTSANALEKAKAATDKDQFDVSVLDSFNPYREVTVNGKVYEGLIYTDQASLDAAVQDTINRLNSTAMFYDVYLNGTKVNTDKVAYGTPVIVNGDGSFEPNAPDIDKDADTEFLAWYYSFSAPSTGSNKTAEKYMTSSPSLGFIVKGDTYLTTKSVTSSEQGYAVKFVRGTDNKVFDVVYTDADGNFTVPNAPKLAYYTFSGYNVDGVTAGSTFQVTADTTIVANYAPQADIQQYTINVMTYQYGLDTSDPSAMVSTGEYSYNEKVSITTTDWVGNYIDEDVYVWCEMTSFDPENYIGTFVPVYYGSDYSFYACKNVDLVAFTKTEFDAIYADVEHWNYLDTILTVGTGGELYGVTVEDNFVKVLDEDGNLSKVSMIGTFVLPEGYKMVETGMLLGPVGSALQVENAGVDGVKRAKSTKFTPGNQFVLSLKVNDTNLGQTYDYAAYAIVELPDGTRTTFYSQTKTDTVAK